MGLSRSGSGELDAALSLALNTRDAIRRIKRRDLRRFHEPEVCKGKQKLEEALALFTKLGRISHERNDRKNGTQGIDA